MEAKKIIITEQGLLDLGFTIEDNDCYTINILDVRLPKFKRIDLWTRAEWGLKMFLDVSEGNQPDQTTMELPHIKHIDELQNLFFALTGTRLNYKPKVSA